MEVKIEETWRKVLEEEFSKEYFEKLVGFVKEDHKNNKRCANSPVFAKYLQRDKSDLGVESK